MSKVFTWHDIIFGILKFNVLTGYTVLLNKKFICFIHFLIFLFSSLLLIKALDAPDTSPSDPAHVRYMNTYRELEHFLIHFLIHSYLLTMTLYYFHSTTKPLKSNLIFSVSFVMSGASKSMNSKLKQLYLVRRR